MSLIRSFPEHVLLLKAVRLLMGRLKSGSESKERRNGRNIKNGGIHMRHALRSEESYRSSVDPSKQQEQPPIKGSRLPAKITITSHFLSQHHQQQQAGEQGRHSVPRQFPVAVCSPTALVAGGGHGDGLRLHNHPHLDHSLLLQPSHARNLWRKWHHW